MKKVLIDTDIIIDYLRTNKGILVDLLALNAKGKIEILISVITVLEITAGITGSKDEKYINSLFEYSNIIPINYEIASFAGKNKQNIKGPIYLADYLIAMSAIYTKSYLATRNNKHFSTIPDLKLLSDN